MNAKQVFNINATERSVDYAIAGYSTGTSITRMLKTKEVIKTNQDTCRIQALYHRVLATIFLYSIVRTAYHNNK
jgi:hypothetical protein